MNKVPDLIVSMAGSRCLAVKFPYHELAVSVVKTVAGRRYDPDKRLWTIPISSLRGLEQAAARSGIRVVLDEQVASAIERGKRDKSELLALKQMPATIELPTATTAREYQKAGVVFLLNALRKFRGALLADDMGCGKSFQALSVVALSPELERVLVLCPASVKYVWASEIEKHYPSLSYTVIEGDAEDRAQGWESDSRIKIANYDLLLRDSAVRLVEWDLVIADECTWLRNYRAKRTRLAKRLKRRYTLGLSGVPLENRLEELHSIMDFCVPGVLGPGWLFVAQHCIKNHYGAIVGYRGIADVRQKIAPHFLRRTKDDILTELPPKVVSDYWIELRVDEWRLYEAIRQQIRTYVAENPKLRVSNVLTELLRLKQCADDLRLLGQESNEDSSKVSALKDIITASGDHKLVVFTEFAQFAKLLGGELDAPVLSGDLNAVERADLIDSFQRERHKLLLSTDAGAYGITLTAADIVVHLDQPWNPARLRQREDRLHRLGQTNSVQVINLLARRTIDEHVRRVLHRKRELVRAVFGEGADAEASAITRDDLLALLDS